MKIFRPAVAAAPLLALSLACNPGEAGKIIRGESRPAAPVTVKVLTLESVQTVATASYVGTVEASRTAVLSALNSGTLTGLTVREGSRVSKGQALATVDSRSIALAHDAAKASLDQAEDGWERISRLEKSGSVSDVKVVEVKTQLEQARASEQAAAKAVENMTVRAPFDGVVEKVWATDGVECAPGERLLSIVDTGSPEIHFPLPENEFSRVTVGTAASVEVPALGKTLEAKVASKGVVASQLSHSYDCVLAIGSGRSSGLMPGMVCKVRVSSSEGEKYLIPSSAVMTGVEGRYVWTVGPDDIVDRKHIEVGGYSGSSIVVTGGLAGGERVIVEGSRKVSTGMKVTCTE